jgi:hypothetical protein
MTETMTETLLVWVSLAIAFSPALIVIGIALCLVGMVLEGDR